MKNFIHKKFAVPKPMLGVVPVLLAFCGVLKAETALPLSPPTPVSVRVTDHWVRLPASTQTMTALYGTIKNLSQSAVTLESVCLEQASQCELHETSIDQRGVASMTHHPHKTLKPGESLEMAPGGYHVMVMGLKSTLKQGDVLKGTIILKGQPAIPFAATVR